jgi:hypothetical protein
MSLLTFLEASVPLTKTYSKDINGQVTKTPYPFVWEFTSHSVPCPDLAALHAAMVKHAALNHCLLKGNVQRPLIKESRAGSTDSNAATHFVVLDLDGLPDFYMAPDASGIERKVQVTLASFLKAVGLDDTSHIVQWSASYGIENLKLRAHIVLMLDRPAAAPLLKQWLIQLNHQVAMLNAAMGLTKTGNSISWALDISACQNDKLIYIAPPVLKGIKDPMGKLPRISLVKAKNHTMSLPNQINSTAKNRELTATRLEALRDATGLPKRKTAYKMHGSVEVMVKPDSCTITEMKQERGFVYFNLNGGDSWAYYHPETNPDYIFNFKGEPAYLTKELLPDYWEQLTQQGARANSAGQTFLAFCDRATGTYWRGTFDAPTDTLDLYVAKNETQVRHFAKQHGLPLGDFIPEWDLVFDPHDSVRVDFQNRVINQFQLTPYMKATPRQITQCPKATLKLITHVLGDDPQIVAHWINWVACILQKRDRTKTAWVWHGVPGTGKGILFNKILRPIFGAAQTSAQNMQSLGEPYNHWMQQSFLIFVDEVQTKALINEQGVVAKLKNYITEEMVPIRAMYQGVHEVRNFTNWILASNMSDVVTIEKGDRRFNVAGYQKHKLIITDKELEQIDKELQSFHDYLLYYKVDVGQAATVLDTSDRATMISISESSVDTVGSAILAGNFGFLMEQLPSSTTNAALNAVKFAETEDYKTVLKSLLARTDRNNGTCNIARDELRTIFGYVVGGMPTTPNKFTSLLKHHRIHMTDVWINTGTTAGKERGIRTTWSDLASWPTYEAVFNAPASGKATKSSNGAAAVLAKHKAKLSIV